MKGKVAALVGPEEVLVKEFEVPEPEPGAVLGGFNRSKQHRGLVARLVGQ